MFTILSLCDFTGAWSEPYRSAGYEVIRVDIKAGQDVRLLPMPTHPVRGILAAPPARILPQAGRAGGGARANRRCSMAWPSSTLACGSSRC